MKNLILCHLNIDSLKNKFETMKNIIEYTFDQECLNKKEIQLKLCNKFWYTILVYNIYLPNYS